MPVLQLGVLFSHYQYTGYEHHIHFVAASIPSHAQPSTGIKWYRAMTFTSLSNVLIFSISLNNALRFLVSIILRVMYMTSPNYRKKQCN